MAKVLESRFHTQYKPPTRNQELINRQTPIKATPSYVPTPKKSLKASFVRPTYMKEPILKETFELCSPVSSYTPSNCKWKMINERHHQGRNKVVVPTSKPLPIPNGDQITMIFDRYLNQLDKTPEKLLLCESLPEAVCLRICFGTIIRTDGLFCIFVF